ncbi:MAG: SprT-like domain-containing protein [Gemmatimonadaceae bacterium]
MTGSARPWAARRADDPLQLQLGFDTPPRNADELLARLRAAGLRGITRCTLTENRAVMVSFCDQVLRVHRGYLQAPPHVMQAIVLFVAGKTRSDRRVAQRAILSFPVETHSRAPLRRAERARPEDEVLTRELQVWHREYNDRYFSGRLAAITLRISGRMRTRLGQYTAASPCGEPAEISISRAHIRRHGWAEALHTLLHEMVHQWQAEHDHAIDHGPMFRRTAREIGITPHARRELQPAARTGRVVSQVEIQLRAARQE